MSHADGWKYGQNFFSFDVEEFSHDIPTTLPSGQTLVQEFRVRRIYGLFRSTFSGNKIFATKSFAFSPIIKDIGLEIGADWCTQNDQFASHKKLLVVGPQFSLDVPKGFFDVSIHAAHEWNSNGYLSNGDSTNFDLVPELEMAWLLPVQRRTGSPQIYRLCQCDRR